MGRERIAEAATLFERAQEHLHRGMPAEAAAHCRRQRECHSSGSRRRRNFGRLLASRGDARGAVEWLERAAEAPAPSPDEGFGVLYDLANALGQMGEPVRALAIFIELEADAGVYRDVRMRIEELTTRVRCSLDRERP